MIDVGCVLWACVAGLTCLRLPRLQGFWVMVGERAGSVVYNLFLCPGNCPGRALIIGFGICVQNGKAVVYRRPVLGA